jgi:hypothetical protein
MRYLLGMKAQSIFAGSKAAGVEQALGVLRLFGKGGVHGVGTVVFTVSA